MPVKLDEQNKMLQATLKNVYEKQGGVGVVSFMGTEKEREVAVQRLHEEIQQLTNER